MTSRKPCLDCILDDIGEAFSMGVVGGSAFHFLKGLRNSPKGNRFFIATQVVRLNAPRIGGRFAVGGGLFSVFDCTLVYARQKEDPWNSIFSDTATDGLLSIRQGIAASTRSAASGGILLTLIEGVGAHQPMPVLVEEMPPPSPPGSRGSAEGRKLSKAVAEARQRFQRVLMRPLCPILRTSNFEWGFKL